MKLKASSLLIAGALFGATALPASANSDAMTDLLKVLRDQGTITAQNYELLVNAAKADQEASDAVAMKVEKVEKDATTVSLKGGHLKIKSADKAFSVQIGGRIMADYAFLEENDLNDRGNASEIRRARLFIKGKLFNDWGYKAQYDFSGNETEVKDAYIRYTGWKPVNITLGNQKAPFGLAEMTSSKYITFIERSAASEAVAGEVSRKNGLNVATGGDNWSLAGMVHMEGIAKNNDGQDEDIGYGARVTFAPLAGKTEAVHLGAAFHHQDFDAKSGSSERLKLRPEVHTSDKFLTSNSVTVDDINRYGLEAAAVFGPFSAQTEYMTAEYNAVDSAQDQDLSTWYVSGSYFLTGESRAYKASKGEFGRVKPKGVVGQGGIGAWELALRYTDLDLEDNNNGGSVADITSFGVNWYATPTIRFMANYNITNVDDQAPGADDTFKAFHLRGQVDF